MADTDTPPRYEALPRLGGMGASWGIWGADDRLGCLNLLTAERVKAAAAYIRTGKVFPLDLPMTVPDPPVLDRRPFTHEVRREPGIGDVDHFEDDILSDWNTQRSSQWDGFRHVARSGFGCYGGLPGEAHGMHVWSTHGIVGRAVLLDVSRWRRSIGRPINQREPEEISPADLAECLSYQGGSIETGDILLIRTGWLEWYRELSAAERDALGDSDSFVSAGLESSEEMAELLWELHVSAVATDNPAVEAWPPRASPDGSVRLLHTRLLAMLGLPIGEMFDLEGLADHCAAEGLYESFMTSAPLNLEGATGSPPHAIAVV